MLPAKYVQRFLAELPGLLAQGVLDADAARRLEAYYRGQENPAGRVSWLLVIFGILGAALVGLGVILLLGHNWENLGRPVRAMLSFAPIVLSLVLAGFGVWTNRNSVAWRETVGTLWMLSVGASIALVSQTYHIPGDFWNFMFTWMLLSLPIVYLLNATTPAIGYLAGIVSWAIQANFDFSGNPLWFWLLFAAILPHAVACMKADPWGLRSKILQFALAFTLCLTLGFLLARILPGLWIIIYAGFFAALYLCGCFWFDRPGMPFKWFGELGAFGFTVLLAYPWVWESIGWYAYRYTSHAPALRVALDYVLAAGLPGFALILLVSSVRRKRLDVLWIGALPVLAVSGYVLAAQFHTALYSVLLVSIYLFIAGIAYITLGFRRNSLRTACTGFLVLAAIILVRFFHGGFSMVIRGLVFILLGIGFLVMNSRLIARRREAAQ